MKARTYEQCTRCLMDTTDPEIVFDENGYCNHCTEYLNRRINHKYQGEESDKALEQIIAKVKESGKGKEYDCVMGLSGGIDSSYAAYIVKQHGIRILAIHLDNGWNAEEAVLNIKNIAQKLGIDYESYVLDWEEFRDIQLAFLKASVPEAETPTDVAIPGALHYYAAKYGVKYIINGGNFATEGVLPRSWHYNARDMKYFNYIQKTFGEKKPKKFPTFGYKAETYYKLVKGINHIYILNYVPFVKQEAMDFLKDKLDWRFYGGKHHESKYTKFIQSYYLYEKFGIDYRRATLSSQICSGEISREEAAKQLVGKPYDESKIEEEKQYIAKKLKISREEFERILNLPGKYFWDYPNDEKKLKFIYDTYRRIFNKEKLSNF